MLSLDRQVDLGLLKQCVDAAQLTGVAVPIVDALRGDDAASTTARSRGQTILESRPAARVYAALRGPAGRATLGGMSPAAERALIRDSLCLAERTNILDVGCGPGNFTSFVAGELPLGGIAVGVDISTSMLERAVGYPQAGNTIYVRADAHELPFPCESFDGVMCYAAMYLMRYPYQALDELIRVLSPGGRLAVMTTCAGKTRAGRFGQWLLTAPLGIRMFTHQEVEGRLREHRLRDIAVHVCGMSQFISATK